jgi:acylphosphatase
MEKKLLYRITIRGRVQGVGFRWNAAREANIRGLAGFARNLSDGSVYIEAEGSREMLDDFVSWCKRGPIASSVKSVDVESILPEGYTDFRIEH